MDSLSTRQLNRAIHLAADVTVPGDRGIQGQDPPSDQLGALAGHGQLLVFLDGQEPFARSEGRDGHVTSPRSRTRFSGRTARPGAYSGTARSDARRLRRAPKVGILRDLESAPMKSVGGICFGEERDLLLGCPRLLGRRRGPRGRSAERGLSTAHLYNRLRQAHRLLRFPVGLLFFRAARRGPPRAGRRV